MMVQAAPPKWVPVHRAHSIERAAITALFTEPLTETYFASTILPQAAELSTQLKYTNQEEIVDLLAIHMSGGSLEIKPQQNIVTARKFNRMEGGIAVDTLAVQRQMISFSTTRYVRWKHFMEAAREHFMPLVAAAEGVTRVGNLRCEYFDRFIYKGEPTAASTEKLFREGSSYVAPVAAQASARGDLWHVHTGNFESSPNGARRLLNVNLDALDSPDSATRSVRVHTFAEDQAQQGAIASNPTEIEATLDNLHQRLKSTLRAVITPELCVAIGISPSEVD